MYLDCRSKYIFLLYICEKFDIILSANSLKEKEGRKMNNNILGMIFSIIYIGAVIGGASLVVKKGKEASRKFIHILLGNWWLIAMFFFESTLWASILPTVFIFVNYCSCKFNIIKAMERDEGEDKDSLGTVFYAVSLLVLVIFTFGVIKNPWIGLCGIFTMAYGDGFAAVFGRKFKSKEFKIFGSTKSVIGSTVMFLITLLIHLIYFGVVGTEYFILKAIIVAILATIMEAVSIKGTDNIIVPIITSVIDCILI